MQELKVQTAQNVKITFNLGHIGTRLLAALLDLIAMGIYLFLLQFVLATFFSIRLLGDSFNLYLTIVFIIPLLLYYPVLEYFWQGKTIGKALMKIRVTKVDGSCPSLGDVILRWLLRVVDVKLGFLMIFFVPQTPTSASEEVFLIWTGILLALPLPVVGLVSMITSPLNQRLGDRVADTVVIQKTKLYDLSETILQSTEEEYEPVYKNVLILSDRDIYIIKDTLENMEKTTNFKYINRLANKAREILEIDDNRKPIDLLKTLMKDYDYLAKKKDAMKL